jgi:hypothetical protein
MVTVPENPPTDVSVNGIDPNPLDGIVVLLAFSVKLGLVCAPARPAAKRRRADRHANVLRFGMAKPLGECRRRSMHRLTGHIH